MDILVKNALIVDGSGRSAYKADVAVADGRIVDIGSIDAECETVIDADGKYLFPGFIDSHSHTDVGIFDPEWNHQRIVQGITTEITGHCGPSPAPNCPENLQLLRRIYFELTGTGREFDWPYHDFAGWLKAVGEQKLYENYSFFVGHGTIRANVMGGSKSPATDEEIERMKALLDESLSQGARGMSFGLSFFPGAYADYRELRELAKVVKKHGGIIAAHRRGEGGNACEAVEEMLSIARDTGVRMNISHVKAVGRSNWGKAALILEMIEKGIGEGLDLSLGAYPYTGGYTQLFQIFPISVWGEGPKAMSAQFSDPVKRKEIVDRLTDGTYDEIVMTDGGADGIQIIQCPDARFDRKTLGMISRETGELPAECAIRLIEKFGAERTMMFQFIQNRAEMESVITYPRTMIISDGTPSSGHGHPRYMGAFSEVLDHFVKESKMLSLEEAVKKMTSMPAERYGLTGRGLIAKGAHADMVIVDWDNFKCMCTYDEPLGPSQGIDYVFLNGKIAARGGVSTLAGVGEIV